MIIAIETAALNLAIAMICGVVIGSERQIRQCMAAEPGLRRVRWQVLSGQNMGMRNVCLTYAKRIHGQRGGILSGGAGNWTEWRFSKRKCGGRRAGLSGILLRGLAG